MPKGRPLLDLSNGKTCPRCTEIKPITEFYRSNRTVHGYSVYCKTCQRVRHSEWRKDNLEHTAKKQKEWRVKNPARSHDLWLKARYGLELGTYTAMLLAQNGGCAICSAKIPGERTKRFHVDHCHTSGRIRGLLCNGCNIGIGYLKHDPALLAAAINYLSRT